MTHSAAKGVLQNSTLLTSLIMLILSLFPAFWVWNIFTTPTAASSPLPPSQDPWYTVPSNFETTLPGTILRVRPAPGNLTSIIGNCSLAYNILYRTTDTLYQPSWAVTTLYVPSSLLSTPTTRSDTPNYLLSYQYPYNSPNIDNAASYLFYTEPSSDVSLSLGLGWYVLVADFSGPLGSFLLGEQSGHAVLDSLRAALSPSSPVPALSTRNTKYALWGYSGGGISSEWAAEMAVQYAPELDFSGAALGGLLPNITSAFETVNGTYFSSLVLRGVMGIVSQFPEAKKFILGKLKQSGPNNSSYFLELSMMNAFKAYAMSSFADVYSFFENGANDLLGTEMTAIYTEHCQIGYHGVPKMPLFVYKAIGDGASPIADTDAVIDRYCEVGARIRYERNTVGGHYDELFNGHERALEWLKGVFSGADEGSGCSIIDVTVNISSSGL